MSMHPSGRPRRRIPATRRKKKSVSSLWYFAVSILILVFSGMAGSRGWGGWWFFGVLTALVIFLVGAVVNHQEHVRRR